MDDNLPDYTVDMHIDDVRILYKSVSYFLERWLGGDTEEQEQLVHMKGLLYRMILDYQFHESSPPPA